MNYQIGKFGITAGVIESLRNAFKKHSTIRISVLKSAAPNSDKIKMMAEELASKIKGEYGYKYITIGFTIVMRRYRKK